MKQEIAVNSWNIYYVTFWDRYKTNKVEKKPLNCLATIYRKIEIGLWVFRNSFIVIIQKIK